MPLYEFRCDDTACGQQQEKLLLLREYEAGVTPVCEVCQGSTHRVMLPSYQRAQRFDPIVVHQSADGNFRFPGVADASVPAGFEKVELRTFAEADAFMRRVNAKERRESEAYAEIEREHLNALERNSRSELRAKMRHMSPQGRAFAEMAIAMNDRKARPRAIDPNVFIEVREFTRSNRDEYQDRRTDWKSRRA